MQQEQLVQAISKLVVEQLKGANAGTECEERIPIGISARHVHLTQEHVDELFGKGYQLTKKKELMGGQFA
ncbi:MAG: phosphate propanoyltransferase, partial [Peptococcaceae bacterium]|nr:phosphate propanoyltransferase [Peptococcaceae bacterium]